GSFATDQIPALAASGSGFVHAFLRTAAGSVMHRVYIAGVGWTEQSTDLGGSAIGSLSAASPSLNRVDVVARTAEGNLARRPWNDVVLSADWVTDVQTGTLSNDPTIISTGERSLDVFYFQQTELAALSRIRHRHYDGTSFGPEEDLGTYFGFSGQVP